MESMFYQAVVTGLAVAIALLICRHRQARIQANSVIIDAKAEVAGMVQLALNNPYPIIQISDNTIIFVNPAARTILSGLEKSGVNHPLLKNFYRQEQCDIPYGEAVYSRNVQHITQQTAKGNKTHQLVTLIDITSRIRMEQQLRDARKAADDANAARGEFLANMSHELRTPMNGIIGLNQSLAEESLKPHQQHMVRTIQSSAQHLLGLLNDILDFSKIEAGELSIEAHSCELQQLLQQLMALQEPVARAKGLDITLHVADDVPECIMIDALRLRQILTNLISNAIKFTHNGSVTVNVETAEEQIIYRVSDTGIGMSQAAQARIFSKYAQAEHATGRLYGGTGLGLAITKELVEMMHGTIKVQSRKGKGSEFSVTLPLIIAEPQLRQNVLPSSIKMLHNTARLLIIDDNPVNLMVLATHLRKCGAHYIDEANSGKDAILMAGSGRYDAIMLDCQMPDIDGFETSKRLHALLGDACPPIIAVTADVMGETRAQCEAASMAHYISKPVDRETLRHLVYEIIGGYETIIDLGMLEELTGNDGALAQLLLRVFDEELVKDVEQLSAAFTEQDYEVWLRVCHKIYGSASNVGAVILADLCDEAQSYTPNDISRIAAMHPRIEQVIAQHLSSEA